ncbi:MAG: M20/M25/M40 family metallo-hydrolase [Thermomicrobiales bacterium]|nr:M20/M25/M40 family metallo-hydrolase [Thermomicrobiales bacterium]
MTTIPENLGNESIRMLQALLRTDTQSPPGNEIRSAEVIREELAAHGIESEFLEAAPGRVSIVARLTAANPTARPVLLMGHIDVVTVEPEKWTRDPFGGELDDDGFLWGRGALDMKCQVAGELAAFIALKESGAALTRDVIFVAFADEEAGGTYGADWVYKNHLDKIDAEFAINEGGGTPLEIAGRTFYTCQAGEKGSCGLKMTVRGLPGHASVPIQGTAFQNLSKALERLDAWQHPTVITKSVRLMLESLGNAIGGDLAEQVTAILSQDSPDWSELETLPLPDDYKSSFKAITRNTTVPTMISGGKQLNVIPGEITVCIDCRLLPGADPDAVLAEAQEIVGDLAEMSFLYETQEVGIEADPASSFFDAIQATMSTMIPGVTVIPTLISGGTDAALLPGIKVYGFYPFPSTDRLAIYDPLVHGHDERIHVDDQVFATEFVYRLLWHVAV